MAARQHAAKKSKSAPKRQVGKPIPEKDLKNLQESINAEMAVTAANQPSNRKKLFSDALLPEEKTSKNLTGRTTWVMPTLFILALVALWAWFVAQQSSSKPEAGIKTALKNIEAALTQQDVSSFSKHVNVPLLSDSIASQMFSTPTENLTPDASIEFSALQERFDSLIKPALTQNIEDDIATFVSTGDLATSSILGQLHNDIVPEEASLRMAHIDVTGAEGYAKIAISRPDLTVPETSAVIIPLSLQLMQTEAGNWQVTQVIDLNSTLDALADAEHKLTLYRIKQNAGALQESLKVNRITKATIDTNTLLVALEVTNMTNKDIASFSGVVAFSDAAGRTLKEIAVTHQDALAKDETLGKTWTLNIDSSKGSERHVLSLPMSAMNASFVPESISFADGTMLSQ